MNRLDTERINKHSPYFVTYSERYLVFTSDYGITYQVCFEEDDNPYATAYWFNLANPENKKSPGDVKIPQTLICIIEEFFRQNPDILLYICSRSKGQQAQRARLFFRWFSGYEQRQKYVIRTTDVRGEGVVEYVALIAQRTHPDIEDILFRFDEEIKMFNEMKP